MGVQKSKNSSLMKKCVFLQVRGELAKNFTQTKKSTKLAGQRAGVRRVNKSNIYSLIKKSKYNLFGVRWDTRNPLKTTFQPNFYLKSLIKQISDQLTGVPSDAEKVVRRRLVEFLVFNSAFGRYSNLLI